MLLSAAEEVTEDEAASVVRIFAQLLDSRSPFAQAIILSAAAPVLPAYPALLSPFVACLLDLEGKTRLRVLGSAPTIQLPMAGGESVEFASLPAVWPPLEVAIALMDSARARSLDALEPAYTDVLSALLPAGARLDDGEGPSWALLAPGDAGATRTPRNSHP